MMEQITNERRERMQLLKKLLAAAMQAEITLESVNDHVVEALKETEGFDFEDSVLSEQEQTALVLLRRKNSGMSRLSEPERQLFVQLQEKEGAARQQKRQRENY